ncbi:hypothetical protein M3B46_10100 [Sphingobacterium daejeonense]|nr:hypothetical protein [Sphingobacterium daejeonense]MCT1531348.1 hypothetical protein [Sphingobacterium daejeonense]
METKDLKVFEKFELEVQTVCVVENSSYGDFGEMTGTGVTVSSSMIF